MSRLTRDGTAEPIPRDQFFRHARGQGNIIFPVQLSTSWIGNLTRLIHTMLYVIIIHTYPRNWNMTALLALEEQEKKNIARCNQLASSSAHHRVADQSLFYLYEAVKHSLELCTKYYVYHASQLPIDRLLISRTNGCNSAHRGLSFRTMCTCTQHTTRLFIVTTF